MRTFGRPFFSPPLLFRLFQWVNSSDYAKFMLNKCFTNFLPRYEVLKFFELPYLGSTTKLLKYLFSKYHRRSLFLRPSKIFFMARYRVSVNTLRNSVLNMSCKYRTVTLCNTFLPPPQLLLESIFSRELTNNQQNNNENLKQSSGTAHASMSHNIKLNICKLCTLKLQSESLL